MALFADEGLAGVLLAEGVAVADGDAPVAVVTVLADVGVLADGVDVLVHGADHALGLVDIGEDPDVEEVAGVVRVVVGVVHDGALDVLLVEGGGLGAERGALGGVVDVEHAHANVALGLDGALQGGRAIEASDGLRGEGLLVVTVGGGDDDVEVIAPPLTNVGGSVLVDGETPETALEESLRGRVAGVSGSTRVAARGTLNEDVETHASRVGGALRSTSADVVGVNTGLEVGVQ